MYFTLFTLGIPQAEDWDERTREKEVYLVLNLVYMRHQGQEDQLQLMI